MISQAQLPTVYRRSPRQPGKFADDQTCLDCGALPGQRCLDLRMSSHRERLRPHPIRRVPGHVRVMHTPSVSRLRQITKRFAPEQRGRGDLTDLQRQILELIKLGRTNDVIHRRLRESRIIGLDTVKSEIRDLFWRLDASDRANAVHKAYQLGILTVEEK